MTRFGFLAPGVSLLALLAVEPAFAHQAPDPREVFELIRTNLPGMTDAQLQTAAVEGLIRQFQPRVWLVNADATTTTESPALITQTTRYDGSVAYLRIGRVGTGLAAALQSAYDAEAKTNPPAGLILDLRFAGGEDYGAAAAVTDLFLTEEKPLLDWGKGSARSTAKAEALHLPVVVLVNHDTTAAAEALAASLRDIGAALVIGTNTAGRAMIVEDFVLSNGQTLRIARTGVKLGSGAALTADGLRPDIAVAIAPADEKALWLDPLKSLSANANRVSVSKPSSTNNAAATTNRTKGERINEATLVRDRQKMPSFAAPAKNADATVPAPVVRDPALARALDVIKALALVRQWRTP
jgi:hypothetical protein